MKIIGDASLLNFIIQIVCALYVSVSVHNIFICIHCKYAIYID